MVYYILELKNFQILSIVYPYFQQKMFWKLIFFRPEANEGENYFLTWGVIKC